jgi:hypothetical protein
MTGDGTAAWWARKTRQLRDHLVARVSAAERTQLETWLTPPQLAVFDAMTVADQRHGLDVVGVLRMRGVTDPVVLLAGLLHDAGKGRTGLWPRVAYSLGQAYGPWAWRAVGVLPGFRDALVVLREHPERSARLAAGAGCDPRTVELIRHQDAPVDPEYGRLLHEADEAS